LSTQTALLVIDVQVGLITGPAYRGPEVLANIAALLARARAAGVAVIYMQHDGDEGSKLAPGAPGWAIHPSVIPLNGEIVIRKRASDSFYETTLQAELEARHIQHLVITGCRTEMCVDTTSRVAISRGYNVTLVADAHSTVDNELLSAAQIVAHHNVTLDDFGTDEHVVVIKKTDDVTF
jgi:nicotinamidase-related amidase